MPRNFRLECLKICKHFSPLFFKISLKLERNIFSILRNFRKINNSKLPGCFSIIFPELIQNLLYPTFFLKFSGDFVKIFWTIPQNNFKISQKCSPDFHHFSKVFKQVFQNMFSKTHLMYVFSKKFSKCSWKYYYI